MDDGGLPDRSGDVIVAGHICLDIIPSWAAGHSEFHFQSGALVEVGPAAISTGGCVSNTGRALHRLGVGTRLLGKVGEDSFGGLLRRELEQTDPRLASGLLVVPDEHTSYSVILSPPGNDRMVLHFSGANDTFTSEDIPDPAFEGVRLFHFGYPPIMRRMYEDGGENLARLFSRAKAAGLITSLDMAYPDPESPAGRADWRRILGRALPHVDVFLPSLEEALSMLAHDEWRQIIGDRHEQLLQLPAARISRLGAELVAMGAAVVGIKLGERGLYLRTASEERLQATGEVLPLSTSAWANRELWSSVFEVEVVGTTGSGDATVAGFLLGLLRGMSPEDATTAACAVGALSVEAADATSGVRSWEETRGRLHSGWRRREDNPGSEWRSTRWQGLWAGPDDGCC